MLKHLLVSLLPLSLAACHQYPPRDCQLSGNVQVQVRSPLDDSSNRSIRLSAGETIRGTFSPAGALPVDAVAVQIGNGGGAADGEVEFRLCQDGRCVEGKAPLQGSKDNDYLEVGLRSNLGVTFEGGMISYEFKRLSGTKEMVAWIYPGIGRQTGLTLAAGSTDETLNLMLRQH
ncbi:hypothetical protein [Xanthomonas phaseoli]|uniref:hypothetical protein n=1 Tax=Xanthomonas phaseoli TaxID=1985254 RepID=UPI000A9C1F6B|nr:hypothetical protein [Xanthomonas phaseoli]MBO9787583.1 hypothetical protein [Xanthomonas phaseoli pv. dieffenbachiae]MBO9886621.1 hypothetical protein [Xanthomonas phaseoli pv. dieffenbachiae]MBO9914827.1 hypothetical protein [Xanthomonas phaseoli pv. dieffenbachiae]MBO9937208.1 hypothetical protein [Xanthomonas phaseoli pv. dieffenbachiae]MBO9994833.1 hypothetical protein [Xanthomonas phaseoli pv. dieffenbachiae]